MRRSDIHKNRMLSYFITAAKDIIEKEGFEQLTVRKITELAGYNNATLYNYFDDLDHLLQYVCISYLREYNKNIAEVKKDCSNMKDYYYSTWKLFLELTYDNPSIFKYLFATKHNDKFEETYNKYYEIFEEERKVYKNHELIFLLECSLAKRNLYTLNILVESNYIDGSNLQKKNYIITSLYKNSIYELIEDPNISKESFINNFIDYIRIILE